VHTRFEKKHKQHFTTLAAILVDTCDSYRGNH